MQQMALAWIIDTEARAAGFDSNLIRAIIAVESAGNPKAVRYEKHFTYLENPEYFANKNGITLETEKVFQKTSWGLMQVMGGTARGLDFHGPLTDLLSPSLGIAYGCRYLKSVARRYLKLEDQIAAYNAGSVKLLESGAYKNQAYVDKVLRAYSNQSPMLVARH